MMLELSIVREFYYEDESDAQVIRDFDPEKNKLITSR